MAAYVFADIRVRDPEEYEEYRRMAGPALELYGGRFLSRGGAVELLEGAREPNRTILLEFENVEKAKAWWSSPEYADARAVRERSAETEMIVFAGT